MITKEFNELAHQIAASTVQSDIESYCHSEQWSGKLIGIWYDTSSASEGWEADSVARAVLYLEHTGRLERNPENLHLVRFRKREVAP